MRFRDAVRNARGLQEAYRTGIGAVRTRDRQRIRCANPRCLAGSVNLDKALARSHPNEPRWDYGIGVRAGRGFDRAIWIEVHPASSHHIGDVLKKLAWLEAWLESSAQALRQITAEYVWVASGSVAIPPGSPQRRILSARGVRFAGQRFQL